MWRKLTVLILILSVSFLMAQNAKIWEKDLTGIQFPVKASVLDNAGEENLFPAGINKHNGPNEFDMLWDNFMSSDTIADDVNAVFYTSAANDLDGDGMAELIASDDDGWTYVFENTGDNTFDLVWKMADGFASHLYSSVIVTDMDGDGLQEIASGFYNSGIIHFYEWDGVVGSDNYTEVVSITAPAGAVRKMVVDNLDSDANQELCFVANDTGYVYEADASFVFNQEHKLWGINDYSLMAIITADLNNNGAKEVIIGHYNYASIYIHENTAEDTYANVLPDTVEFQMDPSEDGVTRQFALTDIDADGYPELYSGDSNGKLTVLEMQSAAWDPSPTNMKSALLLDYEVLNGVEDDINSIAVGDGDEDGLQDVYIVTDDNHVWDWEYTGTDFFNGADYTAYDLGELNGANAEAIRYVGDTDGDGEQEILVGYEGSSGYPLVYWLEHHVPPAVPSLTFSKPEIVFDHVFNLADSDTEWVDFQNIGTVSLVIDSVKFTESVFSYSIGTTTIGATASETAELYFNPLDEVTYNGWMIVYSNSSTSPDSIHLGASARPMPTIYVNEFQAKGTEWVEIYNYGTDPVDLTDLGICEGENNFTPANLFGTPEFDQAEWFSENADWGYATTLNAGEFLISYSTGIDLNNSQGWIYLVSRDSLIIDYVAYGAVGPVPLYYNYGGDSVTTGSAARVANTGDMATDWTADFTATPGLANDCPAPNLGGSIIINEVDYDENVIAGTEFIEFFNPTGGDIMMDGWTFSDGDDQFVIDSLLVPAGGVAVWDMGSSLSISSGDVAYLYDDTGVRVDQVGFADFNPTKALLGTLQRIPDGAGPNNGYDYASSGGGVTWLDRVHTMGSLNNQTMVVFTAQVGGDSHYRSFWMNGSWDAAGGYDPNWSGPLVELKNDGIWPDTSATDDIFSAVLTLQGGSTYNWWVGSENDANSFLEDGPAINVDTLAVLYTQTCVVDPGDAGYNEWIITAAGDAINSWNNADDNLTRNGWKWAGDFNLPAGVMEFKFTVMHSWNAAYGNGGVGGGGSNYSYTVPTAGWYHIVFDDSSNTYTIDPVTNIDEDANLPKEFVVYRNYPNPFNPQTTIKFGVPEAANVRINIYNILGQKVASIIDQNYSAGYHVAFWNGMNSTGMQVASGLYFYEFEAKAVNGERSLHKIEKMMLIR